MNNTAEQLTDNPWGHASQVIQSVEDVAKSVLAPEANRIDQEGYYPKDILRKLGEQGAFALHLDAYGRDFYSALECNRVISKACGSTGFVTWCQNVCGVYIDQSENVALKNKLFNHASAITLGGTALSNPVKAFSQIEDIALEAKKVDGGYVVSGSLPWVSHIDYDQYCGAVAAIKNDDGSASDYEVFFLMEIDKEVVKLTECPKFSGMEGTSTWGVHLDEYFVSYDDIIADPARPFIQQVRGAFILLQVGMATGIIEASIEASESSESSAGHVNKYLDNRPDELRKEYESILAKTQSLSKTPYESDPGFILQVLKLRESVAQLSLKASQAALLHQGARGYLMNAKPQRLIREAQFVGIVTPAIKHLRWEIDRLIAS